MHVCRRFILEAFGECLKGLWKLKVLGHTWKRESVETSFHVFSRHPILKHKEKLFHSVRLREGRNWGNGRVKHWMIPLVFSDLSHGFSPEKVPTRRSKNRK